MALKKLKSASKRSILRKAKKISKVKRIKKCPVRKAGDITVSKIELVFEKFMLDLGIPVKAQHQIGYKFYDFIIDGTKVLIEFDGDWWHYNPLTMTEAPNKSQKAAIINDKYKNKLAAANGYYLIRVWESDFKAHPRSVAKRIKQIIKEQANESLDK